MKVFKATHAWMGVLVEKKNYGNSHSLEIFILVFLGSLSYTLSTNLGNTSLRIAYSMLMYGSLLMMLKVYFSHENRQKLKYDNIYNYYFILLVLFAVLNAIRDFSNPGFSLVTLINNPRALACLIPILGLTIGYNTSNIKPVEKAIYVLNITFCTYVGYVIFKEPSAPKIFTVGILPFAVFNLTQGRYKILTLFLFAIAAWHSVSIDYRALLLRLIFFSAFFISLNLFRKSNLLKFISIAIAFVGVYIFLTDLPGFLESFTSETSLNSSLSSDTRTFLYTEVFEDLSPLQQIIGKGFLGTYFSQVFFGFQSMAEYADADSFNRFSVEVGVLELILKGGYIFLALYMLPIIYVTWKGLCITSSSYKLEYNIYIYLLTEIVIFFIENSPWYHIHFFLLFFFTGYVYNQQKIRERMSKTSKPVSIRKTFNPNL